MGLLYTLRFIADHPLSRGRPLRALDRFVRWQVGSRVAPGPIMVDFVDEMKLVVRPGMTGATANIYVGLQEFDDMAFVLHFLRPGDHMADVGANVGSYSLLAAAAGAGATAFEPVPGTYESLTLNLAVNRLGDRVVARQAALGREAGVLSFTTGHDTMNHVATPGDTGETRDVPVLALDDALAEAPALMKIDVEGYETEVIAGGARTLSDPRLQAVVMELNGSGARYGYDEGALHRAMLDFGFSPCAYDGLARRLSPVQGVNGSHGNILYVRDVAQAAERVLAAPRFRVLDQAI